MSDESLRLDGNAAAGMLEEIFTFEMTVAQEPGKPVDRDLWIGSVWETMIDRIGMPLPGTPERPFQGGRSDGVIKELV